MNARLKRIALQLLPPILANAISRALRGRQRIAVARPSEPPGWEMVPDTPELWRAHEGWSHASIVETQLGKWPAFLRSTEGARPLGQSHEAAVDAPLDVGPHNTVMCFAYALGRAAAGTSRIRVLDWGGGLGHYFVYARKLYPEIDIDYVIKDLPGLCAAGRALLPQATFVADEAEALSRTYDLVFSSSSLQYTRDCYRVLARLCESAGRWLMITRIPIVKEHDDFVVVQRPHKYGYMTEYPGWFFNKRRLIDFTAAQGFVLDREFVVPARPDVPNAPEQADYGGFLFRRVR